MIELLLFLLPVLGSQETRTKLLILPIEVRCSDSAAEIPARELRADIETVLSSVPEVAVRSVLVGEANFQRLARVADATAILKATLSCEGGGGLGYFATVVALPSGQRIGTAENGGYRHLLELRDALVERTLALLDVPSRPAAAPPVVPAAFALYLKGAHREAAALDPQFALAWAGLGESELEHGEEGGPEAEEHFDAAVRALETALGLEPDLAMAIHALASVYMRTGRTEDAAEVLKKRVLGQPRSARLHAKLGYVFRYAGLLEQSIAEYRVSQKLDASLENRIATERQIIKALIYSERTAEAFDAYDSSSEWLTELGRDPDEKVQFYQGLGHLYAGEMELAVQRFDASIRTDPNSLWSRFAVAYRYAATGERDGLIRLADELERGNVSDGERRYRLAHLYSVAGLSEKALGHLEASARSGFFSFPYTASDRLLGNIKQSEEFERILRFIRQRHRAFAEREE